MFIHLSNLDDLITFPARGQHGALCPVVNINGLTVEARVIPIAEAACLLLWWLFLIHCLDLTLRLIILLLLLFLLFGGGSFSTAGVDVGCDIDICFLLWLLSHW